MFTAFLIGLGVFAGACVIGFATNYLFGNESVVTNIVSGVNQLMGLVALLAVIPLAFLAPWWAMVCLGLLAPGVLLLAGLAILVVIGTVKFPGFWDSLKKELNEPDDDEFVVDIPVRGLKAVA